MVFFLQMALNVGQVPWRKRLLSESQGHDSSRDLCSAMFDTLGPRTSSTGLLLEGIFLGLALGAAKPHIPCQSLFCCLKKKTYRKIYFIWSYDWKNCMKDISLVYNITHTQRCKYACTHLHAIHIGRHIHAWAHTYCTHAYANQCKTLSYMCPHRGFTSVSRNCQKGFSKSDRGHPCPVRACSGWYI